MRGAPQATVLLCPSMSPLCTPLPPAQPLPISPPPATEVPASTAHFRDTLPLWCVPYRCAKWTAVPAPVQISVCTGGHRMRIHIAHFVTSAKVVRNNMRRPTRSRSVLVRGRNQGDGGRYGMGFRLGGGGLGGWGAEAGAGGVNLVLGSFLSRHAIVVSAPRASGPVRIRPRCLDRALVRARQPVNGTRAEECGPWTDWEVGRVPHLRKAISERREGRGKAQERECKATGMQGGGDA